MHSKMDVPKKSKRLIIWNGGSTTFGKKPTNIRQNQAVTRTKFASRHCTNIIVKQ